MSVQQHPSVIVLAAGRGERFAQSGGATHKLDAPLGGVPVLQRVLRTVASSGLPWHLVRPEEGAAAEAAGMGDSIARGVRATADAAGWLILPGDLPLIGVDSLLKVARELATHALVLPLYRQQQGHPVGFGPGCFAALSMLGGDRGAAAVVRAHRQAGTVRVLHLNDPGIVTDIDTLDDLARAEKLLATGNH
ncbi:nucleotidyltransferase family protein [Stutzerimonas stutzeri]|uniref:nucleotidyltransferase family protein n=1 Tax=Stutzerimonas stutzeri TaxID=316 RepID=UPI0015E28618|nr:NTP transferase domain-containing protein [Stutzerimonas stutzeri]MBA1263258.1 NTP transferase domain-containing protein [Stutzerimonas stutzeri]